MRNHKKLFSLVLAFVLALSLGVPAFAAVGDTGFSDVDAGAWYAEAVMYCREHGLMSGIGDNQFAPESSLTRAQLAAIFWRYAGSPEADSAALSDGEAASSYALPAINWAVSSGVVAPVSGATFAPKENATRAQVAAALMNYDRMTQPAGDAKILIAYFTVPETSGVDAVAQASRVVENGQVVGNVEFIANTIREETGGDIFAIETVQTYPGEHQAMLDFAAAEMAANARPELSTHISNLDEYDVIFLGYPIWWDEVPAMIATSWRRTTSGAKSSLPSAPAPTVPLPTACTFSGSWPPVRRLWMD